LLVATPSLAPGTPWSDSNQTLPGRFYQDRSLAPAEEFRIRQPPWMPFTQQTDLLHMLRVLQYKIKPNHKFASSRSRAWSHLRFSHTNWNRFPRKSGALTPFKHQHNLLTPTSGQPSTILPRHTRHGSSPPGCLTGTPSFL